MIVSIFRYALHCTQTCHYEQPLHDHSGTAKYKQHSMSTSTHCQPVYATTKVTDSHASTSLSHDRKHGASKLARQLAHRIITTTLFTTAARPVQNAATSQCACCMINDVTSMKQHAAARINPFQSVSRQSRSQLDQLVVPTISAPHLTTPLKRCTQHAKVQYGCLYCDSSPCSELPHSTRQQTVRFHPRSSHALNTLSA
jgi:hypothetical protein